jgi:hypothetical protein
MSRRPVGLVAATVCLIAIGCSPGGPASAPTAGASIQDSSVAPSAVPSASASPTTSVGSGNEFRVVGLELQADPADYASTCPVKVTFSGHVVVAGGKGTVTYRWVSSDGDTSPVKTLTFAGPGSQAVSSFWSVDAATLPAHAGWSSIEIIGPVSTQSDSKTSARAPFIVNCDESGIEMLGFGLGGSECTLDTEARTFKTTDKIRVNAAYIPSLRAGTVVTIHLSRDGVEVEGYPRTVSFAIDTKCVFGSVSPGTLPPGHYRLDIVPDTGHPISGEFDTK